MRRILRHYSLRNLPTYPVYLCVETFIGMLAAVMNWPIAKARAHVHGEIRAGRYDPYYSEKIDPTEPWRTRVMGI